jgi:crossover junction endodeoxyribonuclease RusA
MKLEFSLSAIPKQRPRAGKNGIYTPKETKQFEQAIKTLAKMQLFRENVGPLSVPINVGIIIGSVKLLRGDIDNYAKSILDGLNGIAYIDDRLIRTLGVRILEKQQRDYIIVEINPIKEGD